MKKRICFSLLLIVMMIVVTGCNSSYTTYENKAEGVKINYPSRLEKVDGELNSDVIEELTDQLEPEVMKALEGVDLSQVTAIWFDTANTKDGFTPNINLVAAEMPGLTQEQLKLSDIQSGIQQMYESNFASILPGFKSLGSIEGKELGNNYFLIYKYNHNLTGSEVAVYQALTLGEKSGTIFTFTTRSDKLESSIKEYEKMLSTLEFTE